MKIQFRIEAGADNYRRVLTELGLQFDIVFEPHRVPCCARTIVSIEPRTKIEALAARGLAAMSSSEVAVL